MSARNSRFGAFSSRSGRGKAAGAVLACAVMLLAGCGGSGGSAADAGAPVIRGAVVGDVVYALGDTGPGGGVVFYSSSGFSSPGSACDPSCVGLEALTSEGGPVAWCSVTRTAFAPNGTAIGTGKANTQSMMTGGCTSGAGYSAANTDSGGFNDWYLPSSDELYALWKKRSLAALANTFGDGTKWSSSQDADFPAQTAKTLGWPMGSWASLDKANTTIYFRVIRAF